MEAYQPINVNNIALARELYHKGLTAISAYKPYKALEYFHQIKQRDSNEFYVLSRSEMAKLYHSSNEIPTSKRQAKKKKLVWRDDIKACVAYWAVAQNAGEGKQPEKQEAMNFLDHFFEREDDYNHPTFKDNVELDIRYTIVRTAWSEGTISDHEALLHTPI